MHTVLCNRCGTQAPVNLPACPNCGAPAFVAPQQFAPAARDPDPSGCRSIINTGGGLFLLVLGIVAYVWANGHNPEKCGFRCIQVMCRVRGESGEAWCFGEETFTQITIASALFGVLGLLGVVQGVILQARARR